MINVKAPDPARCAVVTMEMQRGVIGDLATIPQLADVVTSRGVDAACGRLIEQARRVDVPVVHCTVSWRGDRRGTALNTPLARALARNPEQILDGTPATELIPALGDSSGDLISHRHSGLTPFTGTNLDATLRALDVDTILTCGVSVNVGLMGLVLVAADLGYRVIIPTDAIAGTPHDYVEQVLENTFKMVATLTTTSEIITAWSHD